MKISILGTGLIGYPIAERLLQNGHAVTVYNRTASKTTGLKKKGATCAQTAQGAISEAECVLLVLSDAKAISEVLFCDDVRAHCNAPLQYKTIIQMGTIGPSESIEVQKKVYQLGGQYLECPVLGSRKEAEDGNLILMVGATEEKFKKWEEFLKCLGPHPRLIGDVGKAAALKLALNHLIAAHAVSFSLSLGLIRKSEVNVDDFMDILRESSLYAPMFDKKLKNWLEDNYGNPNFPVKHLLKDVELILNEAQDKSLSTKALEAIKINYAEAVDQGLSELDYSSVYKVINPIVT